MAKEEKKSQSKKKTVVKRRKIASKKSSTTERSTSIASRKRSLLKRMRSRKTMKKRRRRRDEEKDEFDVRLVSIRRVSKVKAGGKTLRMSVMVVIGDRKGSIGVAIAKGRDVKGAQRKAINKARKDMFKVPLRGQTIPHEVVHKFRAAKVFLKPASPGTGVIAGSAVRAVVEAAGIKDILSKRMGTKNIIPNVYATFEALKMLRLKRES